MFRGLMVFLCSRVAARVGFGGMRRIFREPASRNRAWEIIPQVSFHPRKLFSIRDLLRRRTQSLPKIVAVPRQFSAAATHIDES